MATVEIARFEDTFVIHFGSDSPRINAYTLASALVGFADAAKAANASINPGYEIEVVVEALGSGSFKATVRTIYSGAQNLFSKENLKSIVLGVIASFVYQHTLAPDVEITVNVGESEVVIEQGETRIVVPRDVHEAVEQVERSPKFRKGVSDAIRAVDSDPEIRSVGFTPSEREPEPPVSVPRNRFAVLTTELEGPQSDERELVELTDLQILRAILERSKRRWQFAWNGIRISAPVTDDDFYADFFAHNITIAPGDTLRARLRVRQKRDPDLGVFINTAYEVVEVLEHRSGPRQTELPTTNDTE